MEQKLKYRLTGAIILVSLAVIFIPVILEGPDNEWGPLSHGIPEQPQLDYRARIHVPQPVSEPVPPPVPVSQAEKTGTETADTPDEPAGERPDVPPSQPETPVALPAEAPSGWYVQVGSFSMELNASGLSKRLELSGYDSRVQRVHAGKGNVYRVMVGPNNSREEAEKLRDKLARERQLEGIVISDPG